MQLYPLLLNITEQNKSNVEIQLYKKISHYAVLASGLGNPNERPVRSHIIFSLNQKKRRPVNFDHSVLNLQVHKETDQVLKSILDDEEIRVFPSLQNYIKKEIVQCLTDIITGIRLYNKQCKMAGEGMPDRKYYISIAILKTWKYWKFT